MKQISIGLSFLFMIAAGCGQKEAGSRSNGWKTLTKFLGNSMIPLKKADPVLCWIFCARRVQRLFQSLPIYERQTLLAFLNFTEQLNGNYVESRKIWTN